MSNALCFYWAPVWAMLCSDWSMCEGFRQRVSCFSSHLTSVNLWQAAQWRVSRQWVVQFIFISWWDNINYLVKNDAASDNDCNDRLMTTSILTIITCSSSSMMSVWWSIIILGVYMLIWRHSAFWQQPSDFKIPDPTLTPKCFWHNSNPSFIFMILQSFVRFTMVRNWSHFMS